MTGCFSVFNTMPDTDPKDLTIWNQVSVDVTSSCTIHLWYKPHPKESIPFTHSYDDRLYNLSLVKSNLQKAVRRGLPETAIRSASQMTMQPTGFRELLRRLPIIMVEDVCTQKWISYLVFYMVLESKGVKLSQQVIERILQSVYCLAQQVSIDEPCSIPEAIHCKGSDPNAAYWCSMVYKQPNMSCGKKNILLAFGLRIAYGGMLGDMKLLQETIVKISKFGKSLLWDSTLETQCTPFGPYGICIPLHKSISDKSVWNGLDQEIHRLPQAVDFHCSQIIGHLQESKEFPLGVDTRYNSLKSHIWQWRSCINIRTSLSRKALTSTVQTPLVEESKCQPFEWNKVEVIIDQFAKEEWLRTPLSSSKKRKQPSCNAFNELFKLPNNIE